MLVSGNSHYDNLTFMRQMARSNVRLTYSMSKFSANLSFSSIFAKCMIFPIKILITRYDGFDSTHQLADKTDLSGHDDSLFGPSSIMKRVAILAYPGCWAMGIYSVTDFFRVVTLLERHARHRQSFAVDIVSVDGKVVESASGHRLLPDLAISARRTYDLIVIPAVEGPRIAADFEPLVSVVKWLSKLKQAGVPILAFTTGASYLAATGLVDGLRLATHWAFLRQLKRRFPNCEFIAHPSCLHSDGVWTTGSVDGGYEALLEILAQEKGDQFAQLCATHLLIAPPEKMRPILPGQRNHVDSTILQVQDWIEEHYRQSLTIEQMRNEVGMAERTFKRRFQLCTGMSPNVYLQRVRIEKAKKLLLATQLPIMEISFEVGYENVSFFIRIFKSHTGKPPAQWRLA